MGVWGKSTKVIVRENNNVDADILSEFKRLNEEYQRLADPIKGTTKQGANYNISHPFERRDISDGVSYLGANEKI